MNRVSREDPLKGHAMNNSTKIFVTYHKPSPVFESDIFVPIHVGAANSSWDSGMIRDDSGDNLSLQNPNYCELTGLYWAWKNYLPLHPEVECVGLCHYRRFLDPFRKPIPGNPFRFETYSRFSRTFSKWDSQEIDRLHHKADVILPSKVNLRTSRLYAEKGETVYSQMARKGLSKAMDAMITELFRLYPDHAEAFRHFFLGPEFHCCLTFVMKRDVFLVFAEWMFSLLSDLAKIPDDDIRLNILSSRTLGFLAERVVDVWLLLHPEFTVAECDSIQLLERVPHFPSRLRNRWRRFKHPPAKAEGFPLPQCLL